MWNRFTLLIALPLHLLAQTSRVPFVGCPSIGQADPVEAPKGVDEKVQLQASTAQRLAYYKASGNLGALAPRGWHCIGTYGSGGTALYVTADPISGPQGGVTGPIVEVDDVTTENGSGRDEIAQVLARVFPGQRTFVRKVIDEFDFPPSKYKFGPFPNDRLIVQTSRRVEFQTPPHSEGLGTMTWLKANDDPIDGFAILEGRTPELLTLRVRLPRELRGLAPVIIQQLLIRQRRDAR
jgi:hypothetical protein